MYRHTAEHSSAIKKKEQITSNHNMNEPKRIMLSERK